MEQLLKLSEETLLDLKKQKLLDQLNLFESETKDDKQCSQTKLKENSELSDLVGNGLIIIYHVTIVLHFMSLEHE